MSKVEDLMTRKVVTAMPQTPLVEAVAILTKYHFNGLPIVDKDGILQGLLTEREMISDKSLAHLNTLLRLLNEIEFYKKDNSGIRPDLKKIMDMKVSDVMRGNPVTIMSDASVEQATALFGDPKANPIPVVDSSKKLVGIISLSDLSKLYGVNFRRSQNISDLDKNVDSFIQDFDKQFVVVSKFRTRYWLFASILLVIAGIIISFFFILRINVS